MTTDSAKLSDAQLLGLLATEEDLLPRAAVDEFVARGERMIKPLTKLVASKAQWEGEGPLFWQPLHATFILGAIGGRDAVPGLIAALSHPTVFEYGDLAAIFAGVGAPAVTPLLKLLEDPVDEVELESIIIIEALAAIASRHPQERDAILDVLLEAAQDEIHPGYVRFTAAESVLQFARPQDRAALESLKSLVDQDSEEEGQDPEAPLLDSGTIHNAYTGKPLVPVVPDSLRFYLPERQAARAKHREVERESERWNEGVDQEQPWVDEELKKLEAKYKASLAELSPAAQDKALRAAGLMNDYSLHVYGGAPWDWDDDNVLDFLDEQDDPPAAEDVVRYLRFWNREGRILNEVLAAMEAAIRDEAARSSVHDDFREPVELPPLPAATPGRNDPCSCGSGKKFKKCCG